jgi:hypothetical protein
VALTSLLPPPQTLAHARAAPIPGSGRILPPITVVRLVSLKSLGAEPFSGLLGLPPLGPRPPQRPDGRCALVSTNQRIFLLINGLAEVEPPHDRGDAARSGRARDPPGDVRRCDDGTN